MTLKMVKKMKGLISLFIQSKETLILAKTSRSIENMFSLKGDQTKTVSKMDYS